MLHLWTESAEVEVQVQGQEPRRKTYGIFMALFMALRGKHDEIKQHVPSQAGRSCFYRQTSCQAPSTRPQQPPMTPTRSIGWHRRNGKKVSNSSNNLSLSSCCPLWVSGWAGAGATGVCVTRPVLLPADHCS